MDVLEIERLCEKVRNYEIFLFGCAKDAARIAFFSEEYASTLASYKYNFSFNKWGMKYIKIGMSSLGNKAKSQQHLEKIDEFIRLCYDEFNLLRSEEFDSLQMSEEEWFTAYRYCKLMKDIVDGAENLKYFLACEILGLEETPGIYKSLMDRNNELVSLIDKLIIDTPNQSLLNDQVFVSLNGIREDIDKRKGEVSEIFDDLSNKDSKIWESIAELRRMEDSNENEKQKVSTENGNLWEQERYASQMINELNGEYQQIKNLSLQLSKYHDEKIAKIESDLQEWVQKFEEIYDFPLTAMPEQSVLDNINGEMGAINYIIGSDLCELEYHINYGIEDIKNLLGEFSTKQSQPLAARKNNEFEKLNDMMQSFTEQFGDGELQNDGLASVTNLVLAYNQICEIYKSIESLKGGLQYPELGDVFSK